MEKQIKEAIEIINKVRETMPECTNKAFLKGALNELNEALIKAKVFSSNADVIKSVCDCKDWHGFNLSGNCCECGKPKK